MIPDYHIHTTMCGHARGSMEELVLEAIEKGFTEIGLSDHLPLLYTDDPYLSMAPRELPRYVERVLGLKEKYSGSIDIRLGIEADYHLPTMEERIEMLDAYPFDYIIGSVHIIGDWIFDDPRYVERYREIDLDGFYHEYLRAEEDMVTTGLFDIVGHPDLVKKFGDRASVDLAPAYRDLLRKIKEAGACYEVNTAGLRWPVGEMYPEPSFVHLGAEMGVPVIVGSDSHCPEDIGRDFDTAIALLRQAGYRETAWFKEREMSLRPLA
ncbi:MAG: histidinol-phosphatase HisJ family protein [Actinobacteria bacterium]|nr:histidinol-phosphatase HisJ family protein [Actinomycetota bacterium]MCG2818559.1 histidinol-phosphatase HisJ family protein [Actinomycetes bacterium]MBU4218252.1 histidinol-phosphatase HisJ family protein [Actinomycetota bacterium]MBU4358677.1 histidinol-phosphatase HisJ family protein [Actinomycetota bacterium]MBU4392008.1 histidinol-phosphatase HisJ family protein [Actinomycetota bacterium]